MSTSERRYAIGDVEIAIRSDLRETLDEFDALYGGFHRAGPPSPKAIHMEIRRRRGGRFAAARFDVVGDGAELSAAHRPAELLPHLEWAINWRVIVRRREFVQIHAASFVRAGGGFVFAGPSGAGKSTLAAGLLTRGWTYGGDELALIDPDTLRLHRFPKAPCIKAGAFDVVRRLGLDLAGGRHYIKAMKGTVGYLRPPRSDGDGDAPPAPVRYVIFPRYRAGAPARLEPMPRGRAAFHLAGQTLNPDAFESDAVPILGRLVRQAECSSLEFGDLGEACAALEALTPVERAHPVREDLSSRHTQETLTGRVGAPGTQ